MHAHSNGTFVRLHSSMSTLFSRPNWVCVDVRKSVCPCVCVMVFSTLQLAPVGRRMAFGIGICENKRNHRMNLKRSDDAKNRASKVNLHTWAKRSQLVSLSKEMKMHEKRFVRTTFASWKIVNMQWLCYIHIWHVYVYCEEWFPLCESIFMVF